MRHVDRERDVERYVALKLALSSLILWEAKKRKDPWQAEDMDEVLQRRNKDQYRTALNGITDDIEGARVTDMHFIRAEFDRNPPPEAEPFAGKRRF